MLFKGVGKVSAEDGPDLIQLLAHACSEIVVGIQAVIKLKRNRLRGTAQQSHRRRECAPPIFALHKVFQRLFF